MCPNPQEAQLLLQEAVANPCSDRGLEATVYQNMSRAQVASEKVAILSQHLKAMQAIVSGTSSRGPAGAPGSS